VPCSRRQPAWLLGPRRRGPPGHVTEQGLAVCGPLLRSSPTVPAALNLAAVGLFQPGQQAQQGRLAGAVGPATATASRRNAELGIREYRRRAVRKRIRTRSGPRLRPATTTLATCGSADRRYGKGWTGRVLCYLPAATMRVTYSLTARRRYSRMRAQRLPAGDAWRGRPKAPGKSTLLRLLAGLETARQRRDQSAGTVGWLCRRSGPARTRRPCSVTWPADRRPRAESTCWCPENMAGRSVTRERLPSALDRLHRSRRPDLALQPAEVSAALGLPASLGRRTSAFRRAGRAAGARRGLLARFGRAAA